MRVAAARAIGTKGLHYERELIDLLAEQSADLRQAARQALIRLSRGIDFGPERSANEIERATALRMWREWLAKQDSR